jgi:N-methylhydantoinase A/oxoprolinase/acetone carboxylase beta subunit
LQDVADAFHTELVLPEHHQVANAMGAIAGSIMVVEEILVYPQLSSSGLDVIGYHVQATDERRDFEETDEALAYARELARERALGGAVRSGADNPEVVVETVSDGLDTYRVRAKAMGSPRLEK